MQNSQKDWDHYPDEPPPLPEYDISPSLKKLVLICIGTMLINFLIAGACALAMRILQTDVHIRHITHLGIPDNVLFYSLLTSHGQVMFFGVLSINTIWFSYYAVSKWGRKPLASMKLAAISFWIMEGAIILLFLDTVLHFGAGWYNLMPLTFLPGFPVITWDLTAAMIFQIADVLVGIAITIFCIVILATLLRGKLPVGNQIFEYMQEKDKGDQKYYDALVKANRDVQEVKSTESSENEKASEEKITDKQIKTADQEFTHREDLPASIRWVSLIGINAWFPKKWRDATPAVPIVLVSAFVTAMVQIIANPGLFVQLASGFASLQNPIASSNWLLTKNAWWFFGHPIVYFPLFIFLGAIYFLAPRYGKERVPFFKWNYRTWPFYFAFSTLVFSHHVFMDIPNPVWIQMVAQTASLGIVWPSAMTIITILLFTWRSKISWNITARFFIAGIAGWMFGGFQGAEMGMWGTDVYLHNTMVMPSHIHLSLLLGPLLMAFGIIYAIFPDLTKKHLSKTLGEIHFWLTIFGGFGLAILFDIIGMQGAIRREADMPIVFHWAMPPLLFFALVIGLTQFLFVYNFVKTLHRNYTKRELEEYDELHKNPEGLGINI
ncbi:MAG TPA: cbb3-type cytochrome c oxidase subunit I [Nitrososphaeraceae archaeon]